MSYDVTITADGACQPNPGFGGYCAIIRFRDNECPSYRWGWHPNTTNNRMELRAIIDGLRAIPSDCKVLIRTDSRTAISWCQPNSFSKPKHRNKYGRAWELVQEYRAASARHEITLEWVKGHAGDPDNEKCDQIAQEMASVTGPAEYRAKGFSEPEKIALAEPQSLLSF